MSKPRMNGQTFGSKKVPLSGREWTITLVDCRDMDVSEDSGFTFGQINRMYNTMVIRYTTRDEALVTMLHELRHINNPSADEDQVRAPDAVEKASLEAMGVDLSPLLKGFK